MERNHRLVSLLILGLALAGAPALAQTPRKSSAIAVTPDGTRVFVVNPDSNSVTALATASDSVLAEIPVGQAPGSLALAPDGTRLYVTNADSNDLSILDPVALVELARVQIGANPFGVVPSPDGSRLYVALTNQARVRVLDAASLAVLAEIPTLPRPKGLAITADGTRVVVTHYLTPAPQLNGNVTILDAAANTVLAAVPLNLLPGRPGVAEIMPEVALRPGPGPLQAWIPLVQGETGNANLTLTTTVHPALAIVDVGAQQELAALRTNLEQVLSRPVSQPTAIEFTPDGATAFIAHMASDDVAVIAAATRTQRALFDVGSAPQGLALTPGGTRLYVANYLGRSVTVVDVTNPAAPSILHTVATTAEPLAAPILNGKKLFFTARGRMSAENRIACISCHPGGGHDARDWNFTALDEGLRNTTDIHGIQDSGAVHFTANMDELQDLEFNIRNLQFGPGLVDGTPNAPFGPPNAGLAADLDDFAAFMDSLLKPVRANPNAAPGGGLTAAAQRGKILFESSATGCAGCHAGSAFTDSDRATLVRHDVGTLAPGDVAGADGFDTTSLLHLFDSARYLHDGSAATLLDVITIRNPTDRHGTTSTLTPPQRQDLVSYLLQLDNDRDELVLGDTTGLPGAIRVPLHARDVSGTRLNTSDVLERNRIWGFSIDLCFPPAGVSDVAVELAGVVQALPVSQLDDPPADLVTGRKTYAVTFAAPIPFTVNAHAPGELVAFAVFTVDDDGGGPLALDLDGTESSLSNASRSKIERPPDGNLLAVGGTLLVGTPAVGDGTLGSAPLRLDREGAEIELIWGPVGGPGFSVTYNVYRGNLAALRLAATYDHACFLTELGSPAAAFDDSSGDHYFLVSAVVAGFGEGSLGSDSSGIPRPNPGPCP